MANLISYSRFLDDRNNFRKRSKEDIYDMPGHSFFKIIFHFYNGDSEWYDNDCGLLAPTWLEQPNEYDLYQYDTAWAYLKNNYEDERADKLVKFVNLLSTISSDCPWYFQEISGVDTALERNQVKEFKFEDEKKRIEIKCLPDSYDQKIGTLLSLYREIVWSWTMKREVLPANLRKFDMSLFIWESPIYGVHHDAILNDGLSGDSFSTTYKLIEFHNCEFDYNSLKSGYGAINNKEGIQSEYSIGITFDDCYESSYNHILMRKIGDFVQWDTQQVLLDGAGVGNINYIWKGDIEAPSYELKQIDEINKRLAASANRPYDWFTKKVDETHSVQTGWEIVENPTTKEQERVAKVKELSNAGILPEHKGRANKGMLTNIVDNIIQTAVDEVKTLGGRFLLGNLYTYSISKMASQLQKVMSGNVTAALEMVDDYAGTNIMNTIQGNSLNSLASKMQGALNRKTNDRRERNDKMPQRDMFGVSRESTPSTPLGSMPRGVEEPKPQATKPYTNSTYDRGEPIPTAGSDIFPDVPKEQAASIGKMFLPEDAEWPGNSIGDIYEDVEPDKSVSKIGEISQPVVLGKQSKYLGNLNKSRTLINNI